MAAFGIFANFAIRQRWVWEHHNELFAQTKNIKLQKNNESNQKLHGLEND